jgi:long-chain acyl-CoA synthetase
VRDEGLAKRGRTRHPRLAFGRRQLAAYKVPRRVVVLEELPRSLIGKVLRREIRNTLAAGR